MLINFLKQHNIHFAQNEKLSDLTTFRIGGNAELVIYPDSADAVCSLVLFLNKNKLDYFVMGNGSNLLFSDKPHMIPIIKTDRLTEMKRCGDIFVFGSGVKMVNAANFAANCGYSGLEFAHGIPGSIGGAVYMNAGAYDGAMEQIVIETKYVDPTGQLAVVSGMSHDFSYRHSMFSGANNIIVETTVKLAPGDTESIKAKMRELMQRRKDKQPLHLPSAGSTFKRPKGAFAGQLIEQCGLRGYRIGGAGVSEKHCGFVVNNGGASFDDVIELIHHVQKTVKENTGYFLECEVEIVE